MEGDGSEKQPLKTDDGNNMDKQINTDNKPLEKQKNGAATCAAATDSTNDDSELGPPIPPDGGYGWVIMCSSFFVNFLVDGVCFSFGIFFLEFLDHFGEGKETTSWVGSVLNGMYLSMGPLVGALTNKFGCRLIAIIGSVMAASALVLSTLSPNIQVLIVTYGLLTGAGFGLMYLPAIVMVGYYFEKRRALATGIAVCGSGIGGFVFAPMCEKLIEAYAWKGATWIIAAICLNGIVCGCLFRPLEPTRKRSKSRSSTESSSTRKEPVDGLIVEKELESRPVAFPSQPKDLLKNKLKYSMSGEKVKAENPDNLCSQSMHNIPTASMSCSEGPCMSMSCDDLRVRKTNASKQDAHHRHHKTADVQRPMYKKDILYAGSVQNLPEYKQSENMESYVKSITSIPGSESDSTKSNKGCTRAKKACKSLTDTFKEMMDFSLLGNPVFCIYGLSCFLCMAGFFVPFIYLPDLGISFGLDRGQAAFLISIIGIANTVARVGCGWISDQPWADCLLINNCALVLGGVATMLCPFCYSYWLLAVYSFLFGTCIAAFVSLRSIIMVELMGLEKLTSAFGLVTLCQGLSSFIGAPIAGALFDATGYYNLTFYVAGSVLALAGAICFPLRRIARWRLKRQQLKLQQNGAEELNVLVNGNDKEKDSPAPVNV